MNKEQNAYLKMYVSTQDFLDSQSAVWSSINRLTVYKNDFDELIACIKDRVQEVSESVGISARKEQVKATISVKVAILSGSLQAFAHENNNKDLAKKIEITKSDIVRMKDQELGVAVKTIVGVANDNLEELKDFGVNENMIKGIMSSVNEFDSLIGKPRNILNNKYVVLDNIENLFAESNSLLKNKLDKVMLMFSESNPDFYNGYKRSRTIVNV